GRLVLALLDRHQGGVALGAVLGVEEHAARDGAVGLGAGVGQRLTVHQDRPAVVGDVRVDTEAHGLVRVDRDALDVLVLEALGEVGRLQRLALATAGGLGAHGRAADGDRGQRRRLVTGGQDEQSGGYGAGGGGDAAASHSAVALGGCAAGQRGHGGKAIGRAPPTPHVGYGVAGALR